jgi:RimJ/RimL family protein N-acetyltransferase
MRRVLGHCELRPFVPEDAPSLALHANDVAVWRNLRDAFPHPYALEHAVAYLQHVVSRPPGQHLAIVVEGHAVGSVGLQLGTDVERISAELGYWLGAPFWGRGIMTEAVRAFVDDSFDRFSLRRIFALPYAHNPASCRVLEKAGFQLEGTMRQSAIKEGRVSDQRLYARVREPD